MNILFILGKMHNFAGMERIFTTKMNYLANETANSVFFMTYEQGNAALPFELHSDITYINANAPIANRENHTFKNWIPNFIKTRKNFKKQLDNILKTHKIDIIICTTYSFDILDIIIKCGKNNNTKIIVESHVEASTILMSAKNKYNKHLYKLFSYYDKYVLRYIAQADCIVTLTKNDAKYWQIYAKQVEVIPNVLTIFPVKVKDYNSKNVIAVGRYSYQKGFDLLINAWEKVVANHKDWKLNIYGNGDTTEYKALASKLNIDKYINFYPATKDIAKEFAENSIFVLSSRYEGFGLVLTEAMSCALPCISFDCPHGPSEIINDGIDGILVENQNTGLLASRICELMANPQKRRELGEKAYSSVQRFSTKNVMANWINLLYSL